MSEGRGPHPTRRQALQTIGVTSLTAIAGCSAVRDRLRPRIHHHDANITPRASAGTDPWPTLGHDSHRTNGADRPGPTTDASLRKFRAAKTFPQTQPIVTQEQIIFPGVVKRPRRNLDDEEFGHRFEAVDLASKETVWRVKTPVHPAPALVAGRTAFCPFGGTIIAVDIHDGSTYWRYAAGSGLDTGSPALVDGTLFVPGRRSVVALDAITGKKRWRADPTLEGNVVGIAVTDEVVLANGGASADPLIAFERRTGAVRWTASSVGTHLPVTDGKTVYLTGARQSGHLEARSLSDGSKVWSRMDVEGSHRPAVADDTLYTPSAYENGQRELLAIDTATGDARWRTPIGPKVLTGPPVVSAESVYVQTGRDGQVLIIGYDRQTGERRAEWSLPMGVTDSLALGDGALYLLGQPETVAEINQGGVYVVE